MTQTKTIKGIFLQLAPIRGTFEGQSRRWWILFIFIVGGSLSVIISLILLSINSNSGLGVQVVTASIIIGFILLYSDVVRKRVVKLKILSQRLSILLLAGISAVIAIITMALSIFFIPTAWYGFFGGVFFGGLVVGIMLVFLYEGYPILRIYHSSGLLTLAGFLIVSAIIYMTVVADWIVPYDPFTLNVGPLLGPPSPQFPLGTTSLGQDLLSRTIAGGAIMLQVAFVSVIICFSIGVPLGLFASYRGGIIDNTVSLIMNAIFAFPGLILAIAIAAILGPGVINMALAIAVVYIPSYFRVVRSRVITVKELPYVEASVALGGSEGAIVSRYILPNVIPSAIVVMSINFADAILVAAGLTFVGLGLPIDVPDWGWDLTFGSHQLITGAWWVITFPGLMIVILALGFALIGEGLNEILTPKLEKGV
ncbi:MAG: ABC transporter permease [Candidatus Odinarchaeota archaeon]